MDKPMNNLFFRMMSVTLSMRDKLKPPVKLLRRVGIKPGDKVLDYGCGPGGYTLAAAELVGDNGKVYALDIQPLASERVIKSAEKRGFSNIETIRSECATGLPDGSLDLAILYDIIHMLGEPAAVLRELYRVLRRDGILSVNCHHWDGDRIKSTVIGTGLFALRDGANGTFNFTKVTGN